MAQKLNKKQGNDQIIADFFKKSIWFVLIITMIIAIVYFYQSRENTLEIVEKEYQPPEKLKIEISPPEILFSEEAEKRGINFVQQNGATGERLLPETMGSGVAFIDFDNDNDEDLIFVNSTSWVWDSPQSTSTQEVYENDGSGNFTNVTVEKGLNDMFYGTGIAVGDVNNDGYDDVVITAVGNNRLYMNQSGENFIHDETNLDCTENGWST
ncbi:MAG: VCBS repeat-containing protein, partial [Xanthomonadales bacterium]|nr:VCBS repeat-containing protein [Xanthomonadales bacterium]